MREAIGDPAADFDCAVEDYLGGLWRYDPVRASSAGLREFDAQVGARDADAREEEAGRTRSALRRVEAVEARGLDARRRAGREFLLGRLRLLLLELEEVRLWQKDPGFYAEQMDLSGLLLRDTAPLAERMEAISARLEAFPALVAAGRSGVTSPQRPFVRLAIQNLTGFATFFRDDLSRALDGTGEPALRRRFAHARDRAVEATGAWASDLEREVLPRAEERFALGEETLAALLRHGEHVTTPVDELRRIAEHELARLGRELDATAARLAPGLSPREAFERVSREHPPADGLTASAAALAERLREFVVEHGIASVPEGRCEVRESPAFARWNPAYISTPGPFETRSLEAIYFISPVEPSWSAEERDGYLRANNVFALSNTTCHEVYPGHYLQSLALRSQPSPIERVFFCYSAGEGWAHYVEQMILDEGFAGGDARYRLEQLRDALLRAARFRAALGLHCEGWSVARAEELFARVAFQDPINARQQAVRGTFDPGYLNYTLGKLAILKLREDYRRERGSDFRLRDFHDAFLAYGLPVPLARGLLLRSDDGAVFPAT